MWFSKTGQAKTIYILFLEPAQAPRGYKKIGRLAIANQPII